MTALAPPANLIARETARPSTARPSSALLGLRLTFGGLISVIISTLIALAALNSEANALLLLFGTGAGAILINVVLPIIMVRRVDVDRIMPEGVVAGRPFTIAYRVRSRRSWLRTWSLTVTEVPPDRKAARFPHLFIPILLPGQEGRFEVIGECPRRARLALRGVRISSRFPFGLFVCSVDHRIPDELTVYPAIGRLRHDPWRASRSAPLQSVQKSRERDNPEEFIGVREYREGDNYRWIHWHRSAHTGELVVREMISFRQTRLVILLDPWPGSPASAGDESGVVAERLISAAATVICTALEQGHRVGLVCRAATPLVIAPGNGRSHRQRLLRELAGIGRGASADFDELVARVRWSTGWNARCMILAGRIQGEHERVGRVVGPRTEAILLLAPETEAFESTFDTSPGSPGGGRLR
jgi:uncharacterized protein (DUF58 family)